MRGTRIEHLVNAVADAHDLFLLGERSSIQASTLSSLPISWSMWITPSFAPPWSGPLSVPMAEVIAEYMSLSVAIVTRALNVEAFMP